MHKAMDRLNQGRKLICLTLIVAFFFSIGGHLLVLQSVAWGKMLASHIGQEKESVVFALRKTFDGKHPCDLCRHIEKHRSSAEQTEQNTQNDSKRYETQLKNPLWSQTSSSLFVFSHPTKLTIAAPASDLFFQQQPPTPPPRTADLA